MSGPQKYDGRRAKALEAELMRRAEAVLSGDGRNPEVGTIAHAILAVAARIGEEVTRRLDQAPAKQADNFYTAAGIGRDPARPATLPVAFKLVDGVDAISAPGATQLMATAEGPVVFETERRIDLVPGTVAALRGLDTVEDAITMPSEAVIAAELTRGAAPARRLRSGAAAGATKVQIDPSAGLKPGMLLSLGESDAAREYLASAVEGDLVTIEPALETDLERNARVDEVVNFAPFAGTTRDHQSHALYLGHMSLLDLPSAATILVSGAPLPADVEWSWWGKAGDDDDPAWQALNALGSGSRFTKATGKLVKKKIKGRESLWLRARLPDKSSGSISAQDVRIAVGGELCAIAREDRCGKGLNLMNVGFEAIANTTPVVPNGAFHPFGREPRLYDSFYLGSDEAFAKADAEVSLCFGLAGADLGPLVGQGESGATRLFGVGSDGLLYRVQLTPTQGLARTEPELQSVPSPVNENGVVSLEARSPLAFWATGAIRFVAAAAAEDDAVFVAEIHDAAGLSTAKWHRLPLPTGTNAEALAFCGTGPTASLYARAGAELYIWDRIADGAQPTNPRHQVRDLLAIEGTGAVFLVEDDGSGQLSLTRENLAGPGATISVASAELPESRLAAFVERGDPATHFIAGYDAVGQANELRLVEATAAGRTFTLAQLFTGQKFEQALPVAFSPGPTIVIGAVNRHPPILTIATANPTHISWVKGAAAIDPIDPVVSFEPVSIGSSANPDRRFHRTADYVVVQRPDVGAYFRRVAAGGAVEELRLSGTPGLIVQGTAILPASVHIVYFDGDQGFSLNKVPGSGDRVLQLVNPTDPHLADADEVVALNDGPGSGSVTAAPGGQVSLAGTATGQLLQMVAKISVSGSQEIWKFSRLAAATDDWPDPGLTAGTNRSYRELSRVGSAFVKPALLFATGSSVEQAASDGLQVWRAGNADLAPAELVHHSAGVALAYPDSEIRNGEALFMAAPSAWDSAGPDRAANPTLSWEYWNGESWWALARDARDRDELDDRTVNFTVSGGVFFKVPADIAPTEVGGKTSHWIRVRLVGGDYGEAEVKEVSAKVFKRDISTIRAPYVTALKLGYCALDPVRPETILTADSLGVIDQTSANQAGLEFPVFMPVAELMNPPSAAEEAAKVAAETGRCDDPCLDPDEAEPSPCDAPGAYESCDSPCIAPADYRRAAAASAQGFVRGLMIGFDKAFSGDTISLYIDALPSGSPAELVAEMLHGGRFVPINVVTDTSYGLTEPGILALALPKPPDQSDLFGVTAHWLRLRPKRDPAHWSPQLRGIHLNAALTRSVESRTMERLGASIAIDNQLFRLAEGPILPGSLELRVREPLAEEEIIDGALDVVRFSSGPPGDWVRWSAADDLAEDPVAKRVFALDADQGLIRFGDGLTGLIPPLGADVLAARYSRVVGRRANGVAPGAQVQLQSPLAGVERVYALDHAAGGSDVEPLVEARRRAAAKLRHGRRILTRADLEDHALTLEPGIAQVRADARRGGMRLVVVMKGAEARPLPARLRGFAAAIREVAGFGLARDGGLEVVAPRLLPLAIGLTLQPRAPADFAEAATQAADALTALFDAATGNHDGKGWPLGRLPDAQDIAAALAPVEPLALPVGVTIERADRETSAERKLPDAIPGDVLVRLDRADIAYERAREAAA